MKKIALFGGTGGLGSQLKPLLEQNHITVPIGSKDVDITNLSQVQDYFKKMDFDIVINASGINYDTFIHKINEKNIGEINKVIQTNIMGNVNLISSCLPKMRENNYGRIIIISSILSTKTVPGTSIYSSCKSFLDTLVRVSSSENIKKHITCNTIRLGYFDGGMCHRIPEEISETIKNSIGLKRWGKISELHSTIEYIIETEYFTGQNLNIEGGII